MAEEILTPNDEGEKKFTQADIDRVVGKRLAEERAKYPTADELKAYNDWKESQQSEAEKTAQKIAGLTGERDTANTALAKANAEIAEMKNERFLLNKGLSGNDLEFAKFMINKNVTADKTFEQAAEEYLKDYEPKQPVVIATSGGLSGTRGKADAHTLFNATLRKSAGK